MEFRAHPALICDGTRTWPPKWQRVYGPSARSASGEIGTLESVYLSQVIPNQVYVLAVDGEDVFLGKIFCERADIAQAICRFLQPQIGRFLTAIAATEFHFDLKD
jgi:hypothetical protein